jgi:hypothetical protein
MGLLVRAHLAVGGGEFGDDPLFFGGQAGRRNGCRAFRDDRGFTGPGSSAAGIGCSRCLSER